MRLNKVGIFTIPIREGNQPTWGRRGAHFRFRGPNGHRGGGAPRMGGSHSTQLRLQILHPVSPLNSAVSTSWVEYRNTEYRSQSEWDLGVFWTTRTAR
eukprot:1184251-Prorocentrum_minimum.AAC.4